MTTYVMKMALDPSNFPAPLVPSVRAKSRFASLVLVSPPLHLRRRRAPTPPTVRPRRLCQQCRLVGQRAASAVANLLGLDLTGLDVPVGLSCSPSPLRATTDHRHCDAPEPEWGRGLMAINCIPITSEREGAEDDIGFSLSQKDPVFSPVYHAHTSAQSARE
ncbi:hypothetical protein B0H13DRAFT_2372227 [Mycena leptocephala]|nr:hypothetical protein B0H13DRAFT_2372227 [Mycena leptocephala]